MSATPVTDGDFAAEVLQSDVPVLVDFWAEWCGPCRAVAPVLDEIAGEKAGSLKVRKLNVDENPGTARAYKVMSIPTMLVFSGGEERKRLVGARGKDQILSEIGEFVS